MKFLDPTEVPEVDSAEYLGGTLDCKANPREEVGKRISTASQCRHQMGRFWRKTKLNRKKDTSL